MDFSHLYGPFSDYLSDNDDFFDENTLEYSRLREHEKTLQAIMTLVPARAQRVQMRSFLHDYALQHRTELKLAHIPEIKATAKELLEYKGVHLIQQAREWFSPNIYELIFETSTNTFNGGNEHRRVVMNERVAFEVATIKTIFRISETI